MSQHLIQEYLKTNKPTKCKMSYRDTKSSKDVYRQIENRIKKEE